MINLVSNAIPGEPSYTKGFKLADTKTIILKATSILLWIYCPKIIKTSDKTSKNIEVWMLYYHLEVAKTILVMVYWEMDLTFRTSLQHPQLTALSWTIFFLLRVIQFVALQLKRKNPNLNEKFPPSTESSFGTKNGHFGNKISFSPFVESTLKRPRILSLILIVNSSCLLFCGYPWIIYVVKYIWLFSEHNKNTRNKRKQLNS